MKNILFVSYGGGHINIINLIAQQLLKDKNINFKILALTTAYNQVVDNYPKGIVKKISDYKELFINDIKRIEKYGIELLEDNYNPNSGISKDDTIMYLGCSMNDLVNQYGKDEADKQYLSKKRQAFLPVDTMKKIITYENIDVVVSTTSPRFEQASFIAGNELGIKTIEILDLFGELYPLPEAKHIVCMNEDVKNSLINQGLKNRKYYFLGQPSIEESVKNILALDKEKIYNKINLNKKLITLLYASQVPILHNKDCTYNSLISYDIVNKKLFKILENLHNKFKINIMFRIHPNEDIKDYNVYFKKYYFIKFINNRLNLSESIAVSDILVTPYSTVAIESIGAHKITFTYKNDFTLCYPVKEMRRKPFIFSDGFEELEKNLCKYLDNPKEDNVAEDFLSKNSVKNIAKLLKEL